MSEFFTSIIEFIASTKVLEQFENWDTVGLFTNPWFLVPFIGMIIYFIVKQEIKSLALTGLAVALFMFLGSSYVEGLIDEKGFIQLNKVLPIVAMGVAGVAVVIYLYFMRGD